MKLSTKGRYGLKAMFELALHYGEGPIPLKNVAESQGISEHYLEQLIAVLRKNGLVQSVRGSQGGYMLIEAPRKITVGDIIRVLEGEIAPADCVTEESSTCERGDRCVTKLVWMKIRDSINEVIDGITLEDMLEDYNDMNNDNEYMYYI